MLSLGAETGGGQTRWRLGSRQKASLLGRGWLMSRHDMVLSKRDDRLKILVWDGTGMVLIYNHLHSYYTSCLFR